MIIAQIASAPAMAESKSVMDTPEGYREFYDRLGHEYEETATVYASRLGRVRYRTVLRELAPFARSRARLLDIGCNDGVYTVPYCEMGGRAHGIDISTALVEKARPRPGLRASTSRSRKPTSRDTRLPRCSTSS